MMLFLSNAFDVGLSQVDVRKATPKVDQDSSRGGRGGFNNQRGGPSRGRGDLYQL